jgi:hypothetical protein
MADLFSNNAPKTLKDKVSEAYFVDEDTIDGTRCEHIALRNDAVDAQMWIAKGDKPVLQRMVLPIKWMGARNLGELSRLELHRKHRILSSFTLPTARTDRLVAANKMRATGQNQ